MNIMMVLAKRGNEEKMLEQAKLENWSQKRIDEARSKIYEDTEVDKRFKKAFVSGTVGAVTSGPVGFMTGFIKGLMNL